jgi:hypothetical protein
VSTGKTDPLKAKQLPLHIRRQLAEGFGIELKAYCHKVGLEGQESLGCRGADHGA